MISSIRLWQENMVERGSKNHKDLKERTKVSSPFKEVVNH